MLKSTLKTDTKKINDYATSNESKIVLNIDSGNNSISPLRKLIWNVSYLYKKRTYPY